MSTASSLPIFTPALGNIYLPPETKAMSSSSARPTQDSTNTTPMLDSQSIAKSVSLHRGASTPWQASILGESFRLSASYKSEYMDESPLIGEPGSFIMQKSRELPSLLAKRTADAQATGTAIPPIAPRPLQTDIPIVVNPMRKGSKVGERTPTTPGGKKRKKSKGSGVT